MFAVAEVGNWKLEVGSWKLEVGSWKLEVGSWKLEVGSWKLEVEELRSLSLAHCTRTTRLQPVSLNPRGLRGTTPVLINPRGLSWTAPKRTLNPASRRASAIFQVSLEGNIIL
jgi:hypothetical protein